MATVLCPTCGTRRIGSFRFCLTCGLDYDAATPDTADADAIASNDAGGSTTLPKPERNGPVAAIEARSVAARLGRELNAERRLRGLTQAQLGRRIGLSAARIGELERGDGAAAPLGVWVSLGEAIQRPLAAEFSPEIERPERVADSLLAAEALILRLARKHGRVTDTALPIRRTDRARSIDLVLVDAATRSLIIVELWNLLDDVLAPVEVTRSKMAEASHSAALAGGNGSPFKVTACWLLLDRVANRRLVSKSQDSVETAFPGSSARCVDSLVNGAPPPTRPGLAWIDPRRSRIIPFRRRGPGHWTSPI